MNDPHCAFCRIVTGAAEASVVAETAGCLAFLDHRPLFPGHVLVIPRGHLETLPDLPAGAREAVFALAQRIAAVLPDTLGAQGTFVAVNNRISQSVPHMHVHVVPRRRRDGLRGFFWPRTPYADDAEREAVRAQIADALAPGIETGVGVAQASAVVPVGPDAAFAAFTEGLGGWWPAEYTWSHDVLEAIGLEGREGGLCYERGPHGFRCDWGRVLVWERPARLVFTWQISPARVPEPDPARASEVEVGFRAKGDGTQVDLVHRAFTRHGEGAEGYRAAMKSPEGWPYILGRFAKASRR